MHRAEWEMIVNLYLNLPENIESEKLDEFYRRGWSPQDTARHLLMQLMGPVLPSGNY